MNFKVLFDTEHKPLQDLGPVYNAPFRKICSASCTMDWFCVCVQGTWLSPVYEFSRCFLIRNTNPFKIWDRSRTLLFAKYVPPHVPWTDFVCVYKVHDSLQYMNFQGAFWYGTQTPSRSGTGLERSFSQNMFRLMYHELILCVCTRYMIVSSIWIFKVLFDTEHKPLQDLGPV